MYRYAFKYIKMKNCNKTHLNIIIFVVIRLIKISNGIFLFKISLRYLSVLLLHNNDEFDNLIQFPTSIGTECAVNNFNLFT